MHILFDFNILFFPPGHRPTRRKSSPSKEKLKEQLARLRTDHRKLKRKLAQKEKRWKAREEKLKDDIRRLAAQVEKISNANKLSPEQLVTSAKQYLKGSALSFFELQISQAKKRSKGRRYEIQDKVFAISLYYQSPKAYRFLQRIFILPCKRTISRWLEEVEFKPGFSHDIFESLRKRVSKMPEHERLCCLIFDEVSLKEGLKYNDKEDIVEGLEDFGTLGRTHKLANQGLVFMVRGLTKNWKQPLCYFLSRSSTPADKLTSLVKTCIDKLFQIGLKVKVCICDQGINNRGLFESFPITSEKPYHEFHNERVYFMYDPPHLLKNIRNNLKTHDITYGSRTAKWTYIEQFYEDEKLRGNLGYRAAHKLTDKHIYLPAFSKMSVKRAVQVLSHSVASGINSHVALGCLPAEAAYTAEFCEAMDQLFNSFNSRSKTAPLDKTWKHACSHTSGHIDFWQQNIKWLRNWEIESTRIQCVKGWVLSMSATIALWDDLRKNYNVKYLLTSRLNQDPIENLFAVVRQKGGCNDTPQCDQFRHCLKAATIDTIMKPRGSNCESDIDEILSEYITLTNSVNKRTSSHVPDEDIPEPSVCSTTSMPIPRGRSLPEENILVYVCGWLAYKSLQNHFCDRCYKFMVRNVPQMDDQRLVFSYFKSCIVKDRDFGYLKIPTTTMINFISICEDIFTVQFNRHCHSVGLKSKILRKIKRRFSDFSGNQVLCSNTLDSLLNLFVRTRIHYAVKFFNKSVQGTKRKNRKYLKVSHL